jgi:hypothetical protein
VQCSAVVQCSGHFSPSRKRQQIEQTMEGRGVEGRGGEGR